MCQTDKNGWAVIVWLYIDGKVRVCRILFLNNILSGIEKHLMLKDLLESQEVIGLYQINLTKNMGNIIRKFPTVLKSPYSLLSGAHLSDSFTEDIEFKLVTGFPEDVLRDDYFHKRYLRYGIHSRGKCNIVK